MVGMILLRSLHRDIAMYNRVPTEEERAEEREESGWKLVHADVFRPPTRLPMIFCVCVGMGVQVLYIVHLLFYMSLCVFLLVSLFVNVPYTMYYVTALWDGACHTCICGNWIFVTFKSWKFDGGTGVGLCSDGCTCRVQFCSNIQDVQGKTMAALYGSYCIFVSGNSFWVVLSS